MLTSETADAEPRPARLNRRAFLGRALGAGAALSLGSTALARAASGPFGVPSAAPPNILIVLVDQMRSPCWWPTAAALPQLLPNLARLRAGAVSFGRHYTAANDCTPSRATLLTGLHAHQTGCLITGRSELDPGFPTFGSMLRDQGYQTWWYGKWHLSHRPTLEPWGFSGGTFPSPDGAPGQGHAADPLIAEQFGGWFAEHGADGPWCTTVSFVNPHDISWWYRYTDLVAAEASVPALCTQLPPNFETPAQLHASQPGVQRSLQENAARAFGEVPFTGRGARAAWTRMLDTYLQLQRDVDHHLGTVLDVLASAPAVAANTIVIFTSDHGEYAGSHGLRGKGAGVYEEAIRVPLYVRDLRGALAGAPRIERQGLTSSVDVAPLLLTLASGSAAWRSDPSYAHLANRANLAGMLVDPAAPGRQWVLHATDEIATEFAPGRYAAEAPLHIIAIRTARAKFALYTDWRAGTMEALPHGQERELYDYATSGGRLELDNRAGASHLEPGLRQLLEHRAIPDELRAPLPAPLRAAQQNGFARYVALDSFVEGDILRREALGA